MIVGSVAAEPEQQNRVLVRRFLAVSLALSIAAIPAAIVLHTRIGETRAIWILHGLLVANALMVHRLWRGAAHRPLGASLVGIIAANWGFSLVFVALEPWAIHFTPMVCLAAALLPIGMMEPRRYRLLSIAAVAFITVMTAISRLGSSHGPLMSVTSGDLRDLIAIIHTPVLFVLVSWICWEGHATIWRRNELIAGSQRRLVGAEEAGRRSIEEESADLQRRLATLSARVDEAGRTERLDHGALAAELTPAVQRATADLRRLSHGILPPELVVRDRAALYGLDGLVPWPVEITVDGDVAALPDVVESALQTCAAESLRALDRMGVRAAELSLTGTDDQVRLVVAHDPRPSSIGPESIDPLSIDRVGALGGTATATEVDGRPATVFRLPRRPAEEADPDVGRLRDEAGRGFSAALRPAVAFPALAFTVCLLMWLTVLPYDDMRNVTVFVAVGFAGPSLVALAMADRVPRSAAAVFAAAHWVTAIVVASQFTLIKFFAALGLLIPVVAALPYLTRTWYRTLVVISALVATATTALTRLVTQLEIASESPDLVNKLIVVAMIPAASSIILLLAWRSHANLVLRSVDLRASRRRVVEAIDRARRRIERDLHDGAQQRLVSAALRLQILSRLDADDRAGAARNLALLRDELGAAERSLHLLERPDDRVDDAGALVERLRWLGQSSPVPLELRLGRLPDDLPSEVATTLWYCCSEAVGNVAKHAGRDARALIEVADERGSVRFRVADDGRGFDWPPGPGGGLRNLADRVGLLGGSLDVSSTAGAGTVVVGSIPVG